MYNLPKLNHIPHRDYPTPYYQKTLQILKEYEITLQELTNGKIRQIYKTSHSKYTFKLPENL